MVKHTQTICWQIADELFEFDHFVGFTLKGLRSSNELKFCRLYSTVVAA